MRDSPANESRAPMLLYGEHFAPWCEKARWALDHHQLRYQYREHVPLVGEWRLRRVSRQYRGVVSVPLLVTSSEIIMESRLIAMKADELGSGPSLFPASHEAELLHWNTVSETIMRYGRAVLLARLPGMPDALSEQLAGPLPDPLRRLLTPVSRLGVNFVARKYRTRALLPAAEVSMDRALSGVRQALSGRRYVLGRTFTGGHRIAVRRAGVAALHSARAGYPHGMDEQAPAAGIRRPSRMARLDL